MKTPHDMLIRDTAAMIRDFDPAAARAFEVQPFQRKNLARAIRAGFGENPTPARRRMLDCIDSVADIDARARAL